MNWLLWILMSLSVGTYSTNSQTFYDCELKAQNTYSFGEDAYTYRMNNKLCGDTFVYHCNISRYNEDDYLIDFEYVEVKSYTMFEEDNIALKYSNTFTINNAYLLSNLKQNWGLRYNIYYNFGMDTLDIQPTLYIGNDQFTWTYSFDYGYNEDSYYWAFDKFFDTNDFTNQLDNIFNSQNNNYTTGYNDGYYTGQNVGYGNGYDEGYAQGYSQGASLDDTTFTIFNGILNVGLLPINVLLAMLNFEVLGINISNFVTSLLTIGVSITLLRMITGGKTGDE